MNPPTFYMHDTIEQILQKREHIEINEWIEELEAIEKELQYVLKVQEQLLENKELDGILRVLRRENTILLANLNRYLMDKAKAVECDTLECDMYHLHHHEKSRGMFREHLKKFRKAKESVLLGVLGKNRAHLAK